MYPDYVSTRKDVIKVTDASRASGSFVVKTKIIPKKDRLMFPCSAGLKPYTPFIQLARILGTEEAALKPLAVLLRGIVALEAVSESRVSTCISARSFALECAAKQQPPIVMVKSSDFTDLYPQFASAPRGDRVCLINLKAHNSSGRKSLAHLANKLRNHGDQISSALAEDGSLAVAIGCIDNF